jgi:hypothetical protein
MNKRLKTLLKKLMYIAQAIDLSLSENEISYNRIIEFWLLRNLYK